jgi:hypothetical protein
VDSRGESKIAPVKFEGYFSATSPCSSRAGGEPLPGPWHFDKPYGISELSSDNEIDISIEASILPGLGFLSVEHGSYSNW